MKWFGRPGTSYEGVEVMVEIVTVRNVQVSYYQIVHFNSMMYPAKRCHKENY